MSYLAWLTVEKGEPYKPGTQINVGQGRFLLGRASTRGTPDAAFSDPLISREHCSLFGQNNAIVLCDLGSRHGTTVNGTRLQPDERRYLKDGDRISLAAGVVEMIYRQADDAERTVDFAEQPPNRPTSEASVYLEPDRHECYVDGQIVPLVGKEWSFLELLYTNANKTVPYDKIKTVVWPERVTGRSPIPDVLVDELNVLIYRLRKKLGHRGYMIETIRGCGCILKL